MTPTLNSLARLETTLYRHALRNIKWAAIIGVAGLVGIVAGLQVHFGLAFVAFLTMFVRDRDRTKSEKDGRRQEYGTSSQRPDAPNMGDIGTNAFRFPQG